MLTLKWFHLVFIGLAIVVSAGFGVWSLLNRYTGLGVLSLVIGGLLVAYLGYFAARAEMHLE
jgi:hypothetical protein